MFTQIDRRVDRGGKKVEQTSTVDISPPLLTQLPRELSSCFKKSRPPPSENSTNARVQIPTGVYISGILGYRAYWSDVARTGRMLKGNKSLRAL